MLLVCTFQGRHGIFLAGKAAKEVTTVIIWSLATFPVVVALLLIEQFDSYIYDGAN